MHHSEECDEISCHPAMSHPEHESSLGPEYPTCYSLSSRLRRQVVIASWYPSVCVHVTLILHNVGPKRKSSDAGILVNF